MDSTLEVQAVADVNGNGNGNGNSRLLSMYSGAVIAAGALYFISLFNYLLFHSLIEVIGIVLAGIIFVVAWYSRQSVRSGFLMLGVSGLFVAILDLVHLLAYKGMGVFAAGSGNVASQLWVASRSLQAVFTLAAFLYLGRKLRGNRPEFFLLVCAIADTLALLAIFQWGTFPAAFVEGQGQTMFKICAEYVIGIVFLLAVLVLIRRGDRTEVDPIVRRQLLVACFLNVAAEMAFTQYVNVYGPANAVGHILRFFAYVFLFKSLIETGLTKPYSLMFRRIKINEDTLKEQNAKLERLLNEAELDRRNSTQLVESIGDGIAAIDRYWNITAWNKAASQISGWSAQEAMGKPFRNIVRLIGAKDETENIAFIEETMLLGQVRHTKENTLLITKDGRRVPVGDSAAPIFDPATGTIVGATVVFRDVSLERDLKEKERLIVKLKDDFLFKTVHDLRAPSSLIRTAIESCGDSEAVRRDPQLVKNFEFIRGASIRITALIDDLLRIGRESNPQFLLECEPTSIKKVIDEVLAEMGPAAQTKGVSFAHADASEPPDVMANRGALKEIFINLVHNAVKYNKKGGQVTIGHGVSGKMVEVWVQDTGLGISAEFLPKLFQPYYRAGVGQNVEGTGLGLYIVKNLVEKMGGSVAVNSIVGQGSRFALLLPLA